MAQRTLQRLASPSRTVSLLVHVVGLGCFTASFRWLSQFDIPLVQAFGGNYQFLTNIGLLLAAATFASGLLADLTGLRGFFQAKNVFSVCATPLEVTISVLYFGLRAIDPALLIPEGFSLDFVPDMGFHLVPAVMLTLDLLLLSPPWTIRASSAMVLSMVLAFLYWGWVEFCYSKNGWYPYPLFELLSTTQRVLLFTFAAGLTTSSTMVLKWLYGRVNGVDQMQRKADRPLKKVN